MFRLSLIIILIVFIITGVGYWLFKTPNLSKHKLSPPASSEEISLNSPQLTIPRSIPYANGTLTAILNVQNQVDHWNWQDQGNSYNTCTANVQGIWQACTFSPQDDPWPPAIPNDIRNQLLN